MKRFFDIFFSALVLIMLLPFLAFIAIIIALSMGRPVLFTQLRPGLYGKPFSIYKFRTMNPKKNENNRPVSDEERLTSTGRFLRKYSLDELPQLFNIIKGNLSFVGPRPLLVEYLSRYTPEQARRHDVKPGITGWAQVNGRNTISWEEKFKLDLWYVEHQSFILDMKILWLTLIKVLKKEGISADGYATMPEFTGTLTDDKG
jgi:sugar transferase EpsL